MPKRKLQGPCASIGCGKPIETAAYCATHYHRLWKFGRLQKVNLGHRKHPHYNLWHIRKQDEILCEAWLDFPTFCAGIGEKPGPNYSLVRITADKYAPTNFMWHEHLRRRKDETNKHWWARKWASRHANNPSLERARELKRKYGLTIEEYEKKRREQNNVCAICLKEESAFEHKSGSRKRLAVDHCHSTGKIRGLLCWRCNVVLGKISDSIPLLNEMIAYLVLHQLGEQ